MNTMEKMTPESAARFTTPEAELAFLREQIAGKERELLEKKQNVPLEKIVEAEVSRYRAVLPKEVLDETFAIAKTDAESIVLNLTPEQHDKKMEELLGLLQTKGIKNTLSVLSGFKDPHLEDDFHRFLVQYVKQPNATKVVNTSERQFRGVDMTLYEVALPENSGADTGSEKTKSLKELLSGME